MHCLNLKAVTNFNSLSFPSRLSSTIVKDCNLRFNRIVACSTSGQDTGPVQGSNQNSVFSRTETYALLKQQLEVAAKSEDYKEAARLRDSLKLFEAEEPVLRLQTLFKEAIAEERFKDAAKYRDEIKEIAPHFLLTCSSDATTLVDLQTPLALLLHKQELWYFQDELSTRLFAACSSCLFEGIRVQVRSVYIEGRSQPSKGLYFFAYRIRITNSSDRPVQLLRRHWIITDANGRIENVHGIGVIGEQPVILPNTSFEYSSACPLSTSSGRMEGDFEMKHIDKIGARTFNVAIAPFSLATFGDGADAI